jgi:transcription initiation factor IIE alpha subunit
MNTIDTNLSRLNIRSLVRCIYEKQKHISILKQLIPHHNNDLETSTKKNEIKELEKQITTYQAEIKRRYNKI